MTDPVACSLTPGGYAGRRALIAGLARRALVSRSRIPAGARLRFASAAEVELRELIAAESRCCPFLRFDLRQADGALELDVTGPPEAEPIIAELFTR
ncbi:MAG TPA: hypothetical protein VGF25_03225 [Thermoleophilaceae bacterium]|jgi:hypothetical protein